MAQRIPYDEAFAVAFVLSRSDTVAGMADLVDQTRGTKQQLNEDRGEDVTGFNEASAFMSQDN